MQFISEAVPFQRAGWNVATAETARRSLHVLYTQGDEVICLGVEGPPGVVLAVHEIDPILSAIEACARQNGFDGDYGIAAKEVRGFDAIGHLSGGHRRLANGWANDLGLRVVHAFPCFRCELSPSWPAEKFSSVVRGIRDLSELDRSPTPFIEITMQGKAFPRAIAKWANVPLSTVLGYASALADDPAAALSIRNLAGEILTFDGETGWASYLERINRHACMR